MGDVWEVECITPESMNKVSYIHDAATLKCNNMQTPGWGGGRQINELGMDTNGHDVEQAIEKLSNRNSVGYDELTAVVFKINTK